MKKFSWVIAVLCITGCTGPGGPASTEALFRYDTLTPEKAQVIAKMPLECMLQEYPNKTDHTASGPDDAVFTPSQLHPAFYGCFDWHSSVHGHWLLVRVLNRFPDMPGKEAYIQLLQRTITASNIQAETDYFNTNILGTSFERTYGWAWLLKLDQELRMSADKDVQVLYQHLQPLTRKIVALWKEFLPKQSYPNKTGVHGNTAFALSLAIDWAAAVQDTAFEHQLKQKALFFYKDVRQVPARFEPDGSDFFSPSLYVADLMTRVLDSAAYNAWFEQFFDPEGLEQVCKAPEVSDRNDYQIVHLDGLMFSKVANMRQIIPYLANTAVRQQLYQAQQVLLDTGLKHLQESNYGGGHWLGTFAVLALSGY